MQSITDKILAAIETAIKGTAPDEVVNVERSRRRPSELTELPLTTVRPLVERVAKAKENRNCAAVLRTLPVAVTIRCVGEDKDLDPLRNLVIERVMKDMTLGGIANEIEESEHDWDGDGAAADADYAEDRIVFVVTYQTSRTSAVSK